MSNRHRNAPDPGEYVPTLKTCTACEGTGTVEDIREFRKWSAAKDRWQQSDAYARLDEARFSALSPEDQAKETQENDADRKRIEGYIAGMKEAQARKEQARAFGPEATQLDKLRNMERSAREIGSLHEADAFAAKIKELE